ncbi:uncharacterized protein LOC9644828 isoform X4 [Selaginella moellendorffii]|uniref:uncharacterized protein LOC9644828 isoform X4 n=1 Tax=Selaginella moellendorffii TaxID=88036 RepID=UPI000D1CDB5F|nr:uncharacterized protein LOC9644828 isoform X4 [Selaginella moellendorffii]|eukprot:XP_024521398.1 uncharacterized protein LOC9644828 isoform X4 [Selaginella moellendorffii]
MPARDMFDYRGYCSVRSKRSSDGGQAQCRGVRCSSRKIEECWQRVWIALMALTSSKEIKRGDMNKLYELWDAASKQQSFYLVISLRDARFDGVLPASSPSVVRVVWGKTLLRQFRLIMTGGNCSCGALDWRRVFGLPLRGSRALQRNKTSSERLRETSMENREFENFSRLPFSG